MSDIVRISPDGKYTGVLTDLKGKLGALQVWEGPKPLWRPKDFLCFADPVRWLSNTRFAATTSHKGSRAFVIVDLVSRIYGVQPDAEGPFENIRLDAVSWAPWY